METSNTLISEVGDLSDIPDFRYKKKSKRENYENKMFILDRVLLALTTIGFSQAKIPTPKSTVAAPGNGHFSAFTKQQSNAAIASAVQNYINKNSSGVGKVKITQSDVQRVWALVWANSQDKDLDSVQLLLRKQANQWKVLVMGTSLNGTGKQYKVPNNLRKKWNL